MTQDSSMTGSAARGGNSASPEQAMEMISKWTTEELLAAEPYPVPEISDEAISAYLQQAEGPLAGGGRTSPGGAPAGDKDAPSNDTPTGFAYPPPFNQHEVLAAYPTYPYSTVGKLFFNQIDPRDGVLKRFQASAASVGKNGIWTAGHCVHNGKGLPNGWSTNLVFIPGYRDGAAPLGQFSMRQAFCRTSWLQNGNPGGLFEDMGAAILNPLNGRTVAQTVGWLGFAWGFPRNQVWTSLGYPAEAPFNGQRMFQDTAAYANDGNVPGAPSPIGIGCSMTGGCSGGPWVSGFGSANHVNGHNSYRPNSQPLEIYSPYFGDNAHSLMQLVTV